MKLDISFKNCIKLFIHFILLYQLYDFTAQYFEYHTVVKSELKYFEGKELPSLTLCRKDHDWKFARTECWRDSKEPEWFFHAYEFNYLNNNENKSFFIIIVFFNSFNKFVLPFGYEKDNEYYNEMTDVMIHNISSFKCMTFFSKLQMIGKKNMKKYLQIRSEKMIEMKDYAIDIITSDSKVSNHYFQLHPDNMIPISIPIDQNIMNLALNLYEIILTHHHLLPTPYDTHCFDYESNYEDDPQINEKRNYNFLSNSECERWKRDNSKDADQVECKLDCQIQRYYSKQIATQQFGIINKVNSTNISVRSTLAMQRIKKEEYFYHLPAINLVDYFCSIGGVIGMWIGHNVWLYITNILLIFSKLKIFSSLSKHLKSFILFLCFISCIFQAYLVIYNYLSHEYIIRMSNEIQLMFPDFEARFEKNLSNIDKNFSNWTINERRNLIETEIDRFAQFDCYISLTLDLFLNKKIDCSDYYDHEEYYAPGQNEIKNYLKKLKYFHRKKNNKTIDRIISFNNKPVMIIQTNFNYKSGLIINYKLVVEHILDLLRKAARNKRYDVSFVQKTIQSSPSLFKSNCKDYSADYAVTSAMDCYYNCINRLYSEFFGYNYNWKPNEFFTNKFIFFPKENKKHTNYTIQEHNEKLKMIHNYCRNIECLPDCLLNIFNLQIFESYLIENSSLIRIFPAEKPNTKYIYTEKMDLNELIYQIGGTLGLWFGLSFYSILIRFVTFYQDKIHKLLRTINAIHFLKNNNKVNPIEECISMEEKIERRESEENIVIPSLLEFIMSEANGDHKTLDGSNMAVIEVNGSGNEVETDICDRSDCKM